MKSALVQLFAILLQAHSFGDLQAFPLVKVRAAMVLLCHVH
jgi:hypothetical protein